MSDLDRLARACVQAAHEVEDTGTAAMLLESAQRFLTRADPEFAFKADDQEFNRGRCTACSSIDWRTRYLDKVARKSAWHFDLRNATIVG
jgi:hypothetical protein